LSIIRLVILIVAAGAALMAALLVRNMATDPQRQSVPQVASEQPREQQLRVLVAKRDLLVGERVVSEDFAWQAWPKEGLNAAFFNDETSAEAIVELAGANVRFEIGAGEPITARKLVQAGEQGFMAAVLTPGMRAAAVEISVESAAGGFILPNDRVDVILTRQVEVVDGTFMRQQTVSETVLENVRVLAIDQSFRQVEGEDVIMGSSATLELSAQDAEILTLAQELGEVALSLRAVSDTWSPVRTGAATAKGRNLQARAQAETAAGEVPTLKVIRYGVMTDADS
jgi:pilus assembly protein CpaB